MDDKGNGFENYSNDTPCAYTLDKLLADAPDNQVIRNCFVKSWEKVNDSGYKKILCSISGGADSDIMLDVISKCDIEHKVDYVWFDTGLEYQATKDHLKYLESKYDIQIRTYKAIKPIPYSCKKYGQPFISKYASEMIYNLQKHDFKFEDKPLEELLLEYPRCKTALKWWCNSWEKKGDRESSFNIANNRYLKEFLIQNPPTFKISSKCCQYAKKDVSHKLIKEEEYELSITGIRKYEGGVRAINYHSCFDESKNGADAYRPLFWFQNTDIAEYNSFYNIQNSDCYCVYGFKRTGCVGCSFNRNVDKDLEIVKQYEPKLYTAANNIFSDSYAYTQQFHEFRKEMKQKEKLAKASAKAKKHDNEI